MRAAGFEDVRVVHRYPHLYHDVPHPSSALSFGTQGVGFVARKPIE